MLHSDSLFIFLEIVVFTVALFFHLANRNKSLVFGYILQSLTVSAILLIIAGIDSFELFAPAILTFLVKTVIAPLFFFRLVRRHQIIFSGTTYLSTPLTFIVIFLLTALSFSTLFSPLTALSDHAATIPFGLATLFISLFLLINRKGALSQIIGILSMENAIVTTAAFLGLEGNLVLELGIAFDIIVWVTIASVFVALVYKQFGTLDVSEMKQLKE